MSDTPPPDQPTDAPPDPGVPDGTVLETVERQGEVVTEKVVYDTDDQGNVIGWHKEAVV